MSSIAFFSSFLSLFLYYIYVCVYIYIHTHRTLDFLKLINLFMYLFIFGCFGSLLLCVGFLQLWRAGATLRCGVWASHCGGFSFCGAWALGAWASVVGPHGLSSCGSQALEWRLSSCGSRAQLLRGTWDLPGPGLDPSPLHWQADS